MVIKGLYQAEKTFRYWIYLHVSLYFGIQLTHLHDNCLQKKGWEKKKRERASAGQKPSKSYFSFSQTMQISCKPVDVDAPVLTCLLKKPDDDNKCKHKWTDVRPKYRNCNTDKRAQPTFWSPRTQAEYSLLQKRTQFPKSIFPHRRPCSSTRPQRWGCKVFLVTVLITECSACFFFFCFFWNLWESIRAALCKQSHSRAAEHNCRAWPCICFPISQKQEITTLHPIPAWHHLLISPPWSTEEQIGKNFSSRSCRLILVLCGTSRSLETTLQVRKGLKLQRQVGYQPIFSSMYSVSVGLWELGWYQSQTEETLWNKTGAKGAGSVSTVGLSGALDSPNMLVFKVKQLCDSFSVYSRIQRGLCEALQELRDWRTKETPSPLWHI